MLSRVSNHSVKALRRVAVAQRGFAALAPAGRQSQQQQSQQQQSQQGRRSHAGLLAGLAALVGGGLAVAACEKTLEQQPVGGGVDYAKVRADLEDLIGNAEGYDDGSYGPILVRLAWHSSGTYDKHKKKYGSDGATMRFSPESNHGANAGLDIARKLLEPVKQKYPNMSYADLYTLGGAVAIEVMGGPHINWRPGRTDAKDESSCPPDGSLPDASKGSSHIRDIFYRMGFNDREITALSGAHALGRCHTTRSGYLGPWTRAPTTFSNEYYRLLLEEEWTPKKWNGPLQYENSKSGGDLMMLPTDLALIQDERFRRYVEAYAADEQVFFRDFARAFEKLLELGVDFDKKRQVVLKK